MENYLTGKKYMYILNNLQNLIKNITYSKGAPLKVQIKNLVFIKCENIRLLVLILYIHWLKSFVNMK